jgi:hypothetical protein
MTCEELLVRAQTGDPLFDPDRDGGAYITPTGLLLLGTSEGGYNSDMFIKIEEGGFRVWLRDPDNLTDEPFHGREWTHETFFEEYDSLVTWAYSW